jgi:hypothetical protein
MGEKVPSRPVVLPRAPRIGNFSDEISPARVLSLDILALFWKILTACEDLDPSPF